MTEEADIHTPEVLATVGHYDYITGVLRRPRDGSPSRFYSTLAAWETTDAYHMAAMQQQMADIFRDRNEALKKVRELIERNQAQERTIDKLQRRLLEAEAKAAGDGERVDPGAVVTDAERGGFPPDDPEMKAKQEQRERFAAPSAASDPPAPKLARHAKIPCGVDGCQAPFVLGTPMAAHRMRKHKLWHDAQMELGRSVEERGAALEEAVVAAPAPSEPAPIADEPLPPVAQLPPTPVAPPQRPTPAPIPDAPATPDAVRENQRLMLEKQFSGLSAPFVCAACGKSLHAQSLIDPARCQRCQLEGRYADDAVGAVSP